MPLSHLRHNRAALLRRNSLLLVVAAALAVSLVGCGNGTTGEPADGEPSPTAIPSPTVPSTEDAASQPDSPSDPAQFGEGVHDFTLPTYSGEQVSLKDYLGEKHVVLVFYRAFW
ncbi:MAG: peroxiredoxin family protein [Chloroflexota bacterium]